MKYILVLLACFFPLYAHADLFEYVFKAATLYVAWQTGLGTFALVATATVYSEYKQDSMRRQAREQEQAAKEAYNASLKDRTVTSVSTEAPWVFIGGEARVGSAIVDVLTSGDKDQYKHIVSIHAAHKVHSVQEIYIAGKPLGTLDVDGFPVNGEFYKEVTDWTTEIVTTAEYDLLKTPIGNPMGGWMVGAIYLTSNSGSPFAESELAGYTYTASPPHISIPGFDGALTYTLSYRYMRHDQNVRVKLHMGIPGEAADASLIADCPGKWTADSKLSGYFYSVIRLDINQQEFQGGIPKIEILAEGMEVYDPRTSTTVYTQNPALILYWYLTSPLCNVPSADIPVADVITAANVCDETIDIGARYTFNGTITSDQDRQTVIDQICACMAGGIDTTTWVMWAGKYTAPVMALEQTDIVGDITITPGRSDADIFNGVTGNFISAENSYTPTDIKPYQNVAYREQDGVDRFDNMQFPFTDTTQRCHNLARIHIEDQRNDFTVVIEFSLKAWDLKVGQRITLTAAFFGFATKIFRVTGKSYSTTGKVVLTLKEDAESIWDLADTVVLDDTLNTTLANPFYLDPPTSITLSSSSDSDMLLLGDGTVMSRIHVTYPSTNNVRIRVAEIQYKAPTDAEWREGASADPTSGEAYLSPVMDGEIYYTRIRYVSSMATSEWLYGEPHVVVGKSALPSNVGTVSYSQEKLGIRLSWDAIPDKDRDEYEVRVGGTNWATSAYVATVSTPSYLWKLQTAGSQVIRVKAIDTTEHYSAASSDVTVTVVAPSAPSISWVLAGAEETISWSEPTNGFGVNWYEVRYGTSFAAGVSVGTTKATFLRRKVDYVGARTYWVAAIDLAENPGASSGLTSTINLPSAVAGLRADIVDHTALIYWTANTVGVGQLPIAGYIVRKGATFAGGVTIGDNGTSTFASVMEQQGGVLDLWCAAFDTNGNFGTAAPLQITLSQPPDYVLRNNYDSALGGTWVNFYLEGGAWIGPVDTTKTWATHFSSNGWVTPQDQIDAGYPIYAEPGLSTGSYEEVIDYGATIPATIITTTPNVTAVAGTVTNSVTMSHKLNSGDAWTVLTAGQATQLIAATFRYTRIHVDFACTAGANLASVSGLNVKLATKTRHDGGTSTSVVGGVTVAFSYAFLAANTPSAQANGLDTYSKPYTVAVIYAGGANPTGATYRVFDSSGTEVAGVVFSWDVTGN